MILPLFHRPDATIAALYGAIVAQARDPRFYEAHGAPERLAEGCRARCGASVYAGAVESGVAAERLSAYVRRAVDDLEAQAMQRLLGGVVTFPEPVPLAAAE